MDLDAIFTNISAATLISVFLGGGALGFYFAALNKFKKAEQLVAGLITFIVIGWSFYLPFAFSSMVTNPDADPLRFVGSMFLWVIFGVASSISYQAFATLAMVKRGKFQKSAQDRDEN